MTVEFEWILYWILACLASAMMEDCKSVLSGIAFPSTDRLWINSAFTLWDSTKRKLMPFKDHAKKIVKQNTVSCSNEITLPIIFNQYVAKYNLIQSWNNSLVMTSILSLTLTHWWNITFMIFNFKKDLLQTN